MRKVSGHHRIAFQFPFEYAMNITTEIRTALPSRSTHTLPETGYLRLSAIVGKPATDTASAIPALIPVCKSTWWAGVRSGRFPQPIKLSARITVWRVEDIRALINDPARAAA